MLDRKVTEISRKFTAGHLVDRRQQLETAISRQLVSLGGARSGSGALAIQTLCTNEIKGAVEVAWANIWRVLSNVGFEPTDQLEQDLKVELRAQVENHYGALTYIVVTAASKAAGVPESHPLVHDGRMALLKAFDQARENVAAEIALCMETARRRAGSSTPESPTTVNYFYSPVGAVVTGARATANVVQNLGAGDRAEVLKALDEFRRAVAALVEVPEQFRTNVIELIDDGRGELCKERPNGFRLSSALSGIAVTVQTAGALQPAYQALKIGLAAFGISLP
jgi:hypothetical protein